MPSRSPEKIFHAFINDKGKTAKVLGKLSANKPRNWLLALTLHSFAKLENEIQLTKLEQSIVDAFLTNGFNVEQLKQHGKFFQQLPDKVREAIFPEHFATLTSANNFTNDTLTNVAPQIVKSTLGMPNVVEIDYTALKMGELNEADIPIIAKEVSKQYASETIIARAKNEEPPKLKCTIKATKFHCNDETGWSWTGSDEPYWIFGSLGAGKPITTRSTVFSNVDSGDDRQFDSNDGCIWGQSCQAEFFPKGDIGTHIELWEHDYGDPTEIEKGVSAAFAAAAGILAATGVAAWISAVVAGVGATIIWLLTFLDEDYISDQTFVFSRQVIEEQLNDYGGSFEMKRRFTDGDGDYTLTISVAKG